MSPKHLTFRLDNLPSDISWFRLDYSINRVAQGSRFDIGPIVNVYNKDDLSVSSRSTTVTAAGGDRERLLNRLRHLSISSDTHERTGGANEQFFGLTTLAENEGSNLDVYFVHGLGGHAFTSWACQMFRDDPSTVKAWPRDFLPEAFQNAGLRARFVTLGYNANFLSRVDVTANLKTTAENLLSHLLADRPENTASSRRPMYFVCHSLGGLVVCQALILLLSDNERTRSLAQNYPNLLLSPIGCLVKGIVFLGTPFRGSLKANLITPIVKALAPFNPFPMNPELLENLKSVQDGTSSLDQISDAVNIIMKRHQIDVLVGCETIPVRVLGRQPITGRESAEGVFAGQGVPITINSDHLGMVKFENQTNRDYLVLEQRIIAMVKKQASRPTLGQVSASMPQLETQPQDTSRWTLGNSSAEPGYGVRRRTTEPTQSSPYQNVTVNIHPYPIPEQTGEPSNQYDFPSRQSTAYYTGDHGRKTNTNLPSNSGIPDRSRSPLRSSTTGSSRRMPTGNPSGDVPARPHRHDGEILSRLSMFDTVFIIDDTSSMAVAADSEDQSRNPISRWTMLVRSLQHIVSIAAEYDKDGIDIQFLKASEFEESNITSPDQVFEKLEQIQNLLDTPEHAGTYFSEELEKAIDPRLVRYREYDAKRKTGYIRVPKSLNLIIITDGGADDEDEVDDYLQKVAAELDELKAPPRYVGLQFVQIGDDVQAAKWLTYLDDQFSAKRGVRDMIDTTPFREGEKENVSEEQFQKLLYKILLGAVTKKFDELKNA